MWAIWLLGVLAYIVWVYFILVVSSLADAPGMYNRDSIGYHSAYRNMMVLFAFIPPIGLILGIPYLLLWHGIPTFVDGIVLKTDKTKKALILRNKKTEKDTLLRGSDK